LVAIPGLRADQEDAASIAAFGIEELAEIDSFVLRLAWWRRRQLQHAHEPLGDIRRIERPVREHRRREVAVRLRDQVLQLPWQQPVHLDPDLAYVAREQAQRLLAGHREQRALMHDAQLARKFRHANDALDALAELVAAERAQARVDLHVDVAAGI